MKELEDRKLEIDDILEVDEEYEKHRTKRDTIMKFFDEFKKSKTPKKVKSKIHPQEMVSLGYEVHGEVLVKPQRDKDVYFKALLVQGLLKTNRESYVSLRCHPRDVSCVRVNLPKVLEELGRNEAHFKVHIDEDNFLQPINSQDLEVYVRTCQLQSELVLLYEEIEWYKLSIQQQPLVDSRITKELEEARVRLPARIKRIKSFLATTSTTGVVRDILTPAIETFSKEIDKLGKLNDTNTGDCNVARNVQKLESYLKSELFTLTSTSMFVFQ